MDGPLPCARLTIVYGSGNANSIGRHCVASACSDYGTIAHQTSSGATVFPNIRADLARYSPANRHLPEPLATLRSMLEYGFLATAIYRYGRWTRTIKPKVISYPFKFIYGILAMLCDVILGINISSNAQIGAGLYIGHYGGIFLHGDMGARCSVGQGVTIGYKGAGKSTRPPVIGDDVYIGTSAVIIGPVTVGHRAVIGANTTVVKDVPAGYTVVSERVRMIPPAQA